MKDFILKYIFRYDVTKPKVGMQLMSREWGKDTLLEVTKVSPDKKNIRYKLIKINGDDIKISNEYTGSWFWFINESYKLA
jgi:hypothetical protein